MTTYDTMTEEQRADYWRAEREHRCDQLEQLAGELLDPETDHAQWLITGWADGHTCREWLTVQPYAAAMRLRDAAAARRLITATASTTDGLTLTP